MIEKNRSSGALTPQPNLNKNSSERGLKTDPKASRVRNSDMSKKNYFTASKDLRSTAGP